MFLSNPARYFVICSLFLASSTSCGPWQSNSGRSVRLTEIEQNPIPFSTKEPDNYQAEIVISTGDIERRIFTARKGARSRIDYDLGSPGQRSFIHSDSDYVYSERLHVFAETAPVRSGWPSEFENDITASLLSHRPNTSYESLGREDGLSKYRAQTGESDSSEIIIFINEEIGLPVRQEFYSVAADGQKSLQYRMDLRDFRPEADEALFAVPGRARKVQLAEFRRLIRQNK